MDRRNFCKSVAGAAVGAIVMPVAAEQEKPKLRTIYRLIDGRREQVRMYELKIGNIVMFADDGSQWWITGSPYQDENGLWGVEAKLRNIPKFPNLRA